MGRHDITHQIEQLDPEKDHVRIYHLLSGYEFPWDIVRALELALYRTFCVPSISALLDKSGEFGKRPQRRYDDTALLMAEICQHGYDSEKGREALRRINRVHHQFQISNEDYLYVLSRFLFEPCTWIERYGWRQLTQGEKHACFLFWREVGRRMNIKDIPPDYESFLAWARAYEREHFKFTEANARVGSATRDLFLSWLPAPSRPIAKQAVYAMLDDELLEAFGFLKPNAAFKAMVRASLRARGRAMRLLPARTTPWFLTMQPSRTYPKGYQIDDLGPPDFLAKERAAREAGAQEQKAQKEQNPQ